MNTTFYKVKTLFTPSIEAVEVSAVTEHTVTLVKTEHWRARRASRVGKFESYFATWEEAHAELTDTAEKHLAIARRDLRRAQDFAGHVKGLKKPTNPHRAAKGDL